LNPELEDLRADVALKTDCDEAVLGGESVKLDGSYRPSFIELTNAGGRLRSWPPTYSP
jgi:hypothetical protein